MRREEDRFKRAPAHPKQRKVIPAEEKGKEKGGKVD